jgi:ACS family tartrate transporter-like MFS transporter
VLKLLPDGPMQASWLTDEEKKTISTRLAAGEDRAFWPVLRDHRVFALGLVYFGFLGSVYGVELWLPQIVQGMGYSNLATGFVVALPFAAGMGAMVLWGRSSDVRGERIWHVALPLLLSSGSLIVASVASSDLLQLAALAFALVCIFAAYGPIFCLPSMFLGGTAAAVGIAFANAIGNVGAFLGPFIIGVLTERTGTYATSMAVLALSLVVSAAIIVLALGPSIAPRFEPAQP